MAAPEAPISLGKGPSLPSVEPGDEPIFQSSYHDSPNCCPHNAPELCRVRVDTAHIHRPKIVSLHLDSLSIGYLI